MCGIASILNSHLAVSERETRVARMCDAMIPRGPDDFGGGSWGAATLGMRRLAIFDPANGAQPFNTDDGRYHLAFNGAIYNHRELKEELAGLGWICHTACDTEVLLGALVTWGETCLPRLRGMFAFCFWDSTEQTALIARDHFGIKPLYFTEQNGGLVLASELNALRAAGDLTLTVDPAAAAGFLTHLAVPAPRTIYREVRSLRPGECARWTESGLTIRRYWDLRSEPETRVAAATSPEAFREGLRAQLEDVTRAHLLADVPVGAFLSGGLDSTTVVALMTKLGSGRLKTFSLGFGEAEFSEIREAAANARHFGTDHHEIILTGSQVAADLNRLIAALDQPTGDGINTFYVSQAARAGGVTAALSGLGGDELFGGYPSFRNVGQLARVQKIWSMMPGFLSRRILAAWATSGDTRKIKLADLLRRHRSKPELALASRQVFTPEVQAELLGTADAPHEDLAHPELAQLTAELAGRNDFDIASGCELRTYMTDVLLRDSDIMSMQHSLELRVPFVDRVLIEWLWQQPAALKRGHGMPKAALADAVRDLLPPDMFTRPKRGFTLPFSRWMRAELRPFLEDTFTPANISRTGILEPTATHAYWMAFREGTDNKAWSRVWSLAMLISFINRGGNPA